MNVFLTRMRWAMRRRRSEAKWGTIHIILRDTAVKAASKQSQPDNMASNAAVTMKEEKRGSSIKVAKMKSSISSNLQQMAMVARRHAFVVWIVVLVMTRRTLYMTMKILFCSCVITCCPMACAFYHWPHTMEQLLEALVVADPLFYAKFEWGTYLRGVATI